MDSSEGESKRLSEQGQIVLEALIQRTTIQEDIENSSFGIPLAVSHAIYRCGIPMIFVRPVKKAALSDYISNSTGLNIGEDPIVKHLGKIRKAGYHVIHGPRGLFASETPLDGIGILNPYELGQISGESDEIDYNLKLLRELVQNTVQFNNGKYRFVYEYTTEVAGALSLINNGVINFGRETRAAQGSVLKGFFQNNELPFDSNVDSEAAYNYRRYRLTFRNMESRWGLSWVLPFLERARLKDIDPLP